MIPKITYRPQGAGCRLEGDRRIRAFRGLNHVRDCAGRALGGTLTPLVA
jgi:hypothetical protein